MASAPERLPVTGVVDGAGRLVEADPPLAALQAWAGAPLGTLLAVPQLAQLARTARELGVPMAHTVTAGAGDHDLDLRVWAEPDEDRVVLRIETWSRRPLSGPRFARLASFAGDESEPDSADWAVDAELRVTHLGARLAERLGADLRWALGQPLTRVLRLVEQPDGSLPLIQAVAQRTAFTGQQARPRDRDEPELALDGEPLLLPDGAIAGFTGKVRLVGPPAPGASVATMVPLEVDSALRTPLDQIIDAADRIVERSDGPLRRDYASYATDIATAARHLLGVLRGMEGPPALQSEAIDLAELAEETVGILQADAAARGVTIDLAQLTGPLPAWGDGRAVIQILINLIANAVRHSPSGGAVTLLGGADQRPSLTVADWGPGIAAADQQRIFERFEQVGATPGGTGLGLTIARRLARAMGGDITVDSAPGAGARFTLSLPAQAGAP